jgi:hypothetical protein
MLQHGIIARMDKRNIAIIVALAAIIVFLFISAPGNTNNSSSGNNSFFSGFSLPFGNKLPNLTDSFTTTSAWATFQDYLKYAKTNDLEGVESLSYQVSETCQNPETREECNSLMNGVYLIAKDFKLENFTSTSYDDKQIIMSTDYMVIEEGIDPVKVALYFIKNEKGSPQILGIRFCYGNESEDKRCVNTNPESRDSDKDGWWDDIEVLMNR